MTIQLDKQSQQKKLLRYLAESLMRTQRSSLIVRVNGFYRLGSNGKTYLL